MQATHQTVQLRHGRHVSPDRGACVVELASMLASEPFSDKPRSVCPVIAGFLRGYNDLMPEAELPELYPYAALVVGSAAPRWARRQRAQRLLEWSGTRTPLRGRLLGRGQAWGLAILPAVEFALRLPPDRRRLEVAQLLEELVAIGARPGADEPPAVPATTSPVTAGDDAPNTVGVTASR